MNLDQIKQKVYQKNQHFFRETIDDIVDAYLLCAIMAIADNKKVVIPGVGSFTLRKSQAKGATKELKIRDGYDRFTVRYRPSQILRNHLNRERS